MSFTFAFSCSKCGAEYTVRSEDEDWREQHPTSWCPQCGFQGPKPSQKEEV